MSDLELRKYFEFDEADLQANRLGKLSKKQELKFQADKAAHKKSTLKFVLYMALFGLALSAFILVGRIPGGLTLANLESQFSQNPQSILGAIFIPWILPGIFIVGALWLSRMKLDFSVMKAEGKVKFVKVEKRERQKIASGNTSYRTVEEYELRVGPKAFENVDEELLNSIEDGDLYVFYYTKDAEQILSCELISKGK